MKPFFSLLSCNLPYRPEIRADTNRDGVIDDADAKDKTIWTHERGAIFLPSVGDSLSRCATVDLNDEPLSNDELAYCHDASGDSVLAPEYLAPLRLMPLNVSDDVVGRVYATPREAHERVRIFMFVHDDDSAPPERESWAFLERGAQISADMLRQGVTLGIDSREFVRDAAVWNGTTVVRFDVFHASDPDQVVVGDSVAMQVAPVLTHHHLQEVETLVSAAAEEEGGRFDRRAQKRFNAEVDEARQVAGIEKELLLLKNGSGDIWVQDLLEPAYASMPGPHGPIAIRILLRSAQVWRGSGRQVFTDLRGPGIGGFQPRTFGNEGFFHTIDSLGNVETIPPYTSRSGVGYPAGRVIYGQHFGRHIAQPMRDFFEGQAGGLQKPLVLKTGWLLVGHVDEFVQFLPYDNDLGFTIGVTDTELAYSLLEEAAAAGEGDSLVVNPPPPRDNVSFDGTLPHLHLDVTVSEMLGNGRLAEINAYAQGKIDQNTEILLDELPLDEADIIRLPVLFQSFDAGGEPALYSALQDGEHILGFFSPDVVNGVVVGKHYLSPNPFGPVVDGVDLFAAAVEKAYSRAGMNVTFVDTFHSHHLGGGEVHCGTNALRAVDSVWWE
ncbi:hypothetical protein SODALDRAFT_336512 [Sodiomyces alkalinus F11]|uniref:Protein-arginine deiminase C-terminal domain-containing protein n=1 Tax=Sodiomyces alkalinus (strain CBS 110278 / VKM F-3762 / F11) TaxID=1314773 RepID=A0A3N2Q860_SODAK|nr:hypothetical protein SODALDRAFT_336512 [Sodiomyces alkalinus F11]ROT42954.1 hypothetical protein SODALDRAFT_336512 [Sodiomyces alkalinus F11]